MESERYAKQSLSGMQVYPQYVKWRILLAQETICRI
nr:MAG TPA: hypothetical protein [Caudoviricetes sp.]